MRNVLLFDPADPGVAEWWERAGEGVEVTAGLRMLDGKADRGGGCAIEMVGGKQRGVGLSSKPGWAGCAFVLGY